MSTRQYLYDNFENFDKPTEDDFKVLIDWGGAPTKFLERAIPVYTDILTDINTHTFVMAIRETYIIEYGTDTYILFGLEGVYGDQGITIDYTNLTLIGNRSTGSLTQSLTSNTTIPGAGISAGDTFPAGTSYETLFRELLIDNTISNLRYEADLPGEYVEVGDTVNITKFIWDVGGEPLNMVLEDSEGQFSSPVTGSQISIAEAYTYNEFKQVTWTLTSSNSDTTIRNTYWVERTYYGTNLTGDTPTSGEILSGSSTLVLTEDGVTVPINTVVTEYGWIAVENAQTNGIYTNWEISAFNTSPIGSTQFIKSAGNVNVNGVFYNVYIYTYPSQVTILKLF